MKTDSRTLALALTAATFAGTAAAQAPPDPRALIAAQREAMSALQAMNGVWRAAAWTLLPSGEKHHIVQTERIGPFLDGSVKVIDGRGYEPDGRTSFNAFGIVSYDLRAEAYTFRSYAAVTAAGLAGPAQLPTRPPSFFVIASVAERGRAVAPPAP